MVTIGIVHTDLTGFRGADSLCCNVIEALQGDHSVELLTFTDPDFDVLNEQFETAVDRPPVRRITTVGGRLWSSGYLDAELLATAFLCRAVNRCADNYDLLVSTISEFNLTGPSVQYVHYPRHSYRLSSRLGTLGAAYNRACEAVTGYSTEAVTDGTRLLTNSKYTKTEIKRLYDAEVGVVYPPVDTTGLATNAWGDRESGFVSIGAITPWKRQLRMINILEAVRYLGHNVDYHIVGQLDDPEYVERVRDAAVTRDWIHFEGEVSRDRIRELLTSHKYALHGMPNEHFGIAVAEMVAAGTVPFVPDDGGQREVVENDHRLCYEDKTDAVKKIDRVLSDKQLAADIHAGLPDVKSRFGRGRFQREIRAEVDAALETL